MELVLVYNANKKVGDQMVDYLHKVFSPSTYDCKLCSLTHHNLGARRAWKEFIESSDLPMQFLYKDQFKAKYQEDFDFPVVLSYDKSGFTRILGKKELESLNDLEEFLVLLKERLPKTAVE